MVLFPGVAMPVIIGRPKSMRLIKEAVHKKSLIGVVCQKEMDTEDPVLEDLYTTGVIADIVRVLEMPDGSTTVILQGKKRFELNELTETLRQQDVPYDEGRLWNKNMIARILADTRYTGERGYPKLIDKEQLIAANEKRSNKPQLPKKTEAQKVLRRLCGTPLSERVEQSVTDLLNGLANCPERIQHQRSSTPATHSETQEALNDTLAQQPIDEDSAKVLILRLAAEQYAALGNEEYETNRLRRLFSAFECVAELNADLLKSTVSEVLVTRQNVKLQLKNGQVIERSDLQ